MMLIHTKSRSFCSCKLHTTSNYSVLNIIDLVILPTLLLLMITLKRSDCEVISCPTTTNNSVIDLNESIDENQVQCTLETLITTNSSQSHVVECLDNETIRIIGEYEILRIFCSATFPLDLEYNGFQPTEAIRVQFSKEIEPNSFRKLMFYKLEIKIYSIEALYNFYVQNNTQQQQQQSQNVLNEKETNQVERHTTSRTGRYKIHDVFNKTRHKSIYLFLEDEASSLSLMRNQHTMQTILLMQDNNTTSSSQINSNPNGTIIIPCRPSHLNANVSLYIQTEQNGTLSSEEILIDNQNVTYLPKLGFVVNSLTSNYYSVVDTSTHFICKLTDIVQIEESKSLNTILKFNYPPDKEIPKYGFEDLPTGSIQENINIHSQVVVIDMYNFQINIDCTVDNPTDSVMTVIEAKSPSHSHLVQEFVFPSYIDGSYSGKYGVKASPPGVMTLRGVGMAGLVFCMSRRIVGDDMDYKVLEYATGFDRKVRFFKYGQDWSYFDVTQSPAVNHLQIIPGVLTDEQQEVSGYYINQNYTFKCRVRVHGLAPPVVWYQKLENGSIIEEYIDYTLDDENFSYFNLKITSETNEIFAAASFWDRDLWKNVSLPIKPMRKEGQSPIITNNNYVVEFIYGTSNQVLKCEATGDPRPNLSWEKDSTVLKSENSTGSLILEFPVVDYKHAGNYICNAKNILGTISRTFSVNVVEEERANYIISVGIPTVVFIIATLGTYVYFRYFRKEPIGLTEKEIEEFEQGNPEFTKEMDYMVPENALNIPYNRDYEIEEKHFQIATTEVLGSGQFGVVYKGIVRGQSVAVKTLKPNADKDYLKALLSELKIMCYLGKHAHLVQLIGANTSKLRKGNAYIFVELCTMGSLEHYLRNNRQNFVPDAQCGNGNSSSYVSHNLDGLDTQQLYIWSYQICKAMEYLASKKVIHGDLATRNVLLSTDKQAKVTDFGLSRQLYNYELYVKKNQEPLPWRWMAVESLRDLIFSIHSDAWSFGITLWEIFTLAEVPYPGLSWSLDFIQKLEQGLRMLKPKYATQKLYEEVLLQCWQPDPECRPSFEHMSQYILNLINIKPLPPHYVKHSDLLTTMEVG